MSNELILILIAVVFFGGLYIAITEEPKTLRETWQEFTEEISLTRKELDNVWALIKSIWTK